MHVQLTTSGTISQADLDTWLAAYGAAFKTAFQAVLPTDLTVNYFKAVLYTPGGGELVSTYTPTAWAGTAGTATSVGGPAYVISWQSGVYWRGGKPRTYFPLPTGYVSGATDTLASGTRTTITTAATGFKNAVNALTSGSITGTVHGFVSFRTGNAPRGTPLFFAIVGAVVHPRVGSQRRRQGKWQN